VVNFQRQHYRRPVRPLCANTERDDINMNNSLALLAAGAAVGFTACVVNTAAGLDDVAPIAAAVAAALPG